MDLPVDAALRIDDPEGGSGPLGGLVTGLAARAFDEAIVLAVDLPLLMPGTLAALRALRGDAPAILPAPDGVPQPLAAWYTPLALPALARSLAAGARAGTGAALPRAAGGARNE